MDIQDKVEHISRALDNQAFSQELQAILDLDKQIFVLVRAHVGKVRIIISETPELNYSFFHRDQDFIVSLDDDLSLKEVYAEMNDHLMTEEKLLKLAQAVALIKSKLENQSIHLYNRAKRRRSRSSLSDWRNCSRSKSKRH